MKTTQQGHPKKAKEVTHVSSLKEIDIAGEIAYNYGFTPIVSPKINQEDKTKAKPFKEYDLHNGETEERIACMRLFQNMSFGHIPQPPMLFLKKTPQGNGAKKKTGYDMCGLEILNVHKASAEALIIKTAWAILEESGFTDLQLEINSIGDRESFARFERELNSYFRKNIHNLSNEARQQFKEDIFLITTSTNKETEGFRSNAPKSISSLSEQSRIHFKEVLEFLEYLDIPYQINTSLLPNKYYASHTVFEIKGTQGKNKDVVLAYGSRYNYIARKIGFKKDVAYCGATVIYPKQVVVKQKTLEKIKPARFYLVQLGNLAKFHTLGIIERLRQENIRVHHSLTKENIGGQLASAEYLKCSHLLIIGQKEAIEKSVVVRSMDVRIQETVAMSELCQHLKQILKKL